jgi:hypothetical protein
MSATQEGLKAGTLEGDKQLVTVLLAQFNSCRVEIQARSANQAALVNLNITAIGLICGFYFSAHADPRLLFVIPLLSPMLGIIWADHAINIGNIGRFIQHEIMPRLRQTVDRDLPDYEIWIRAFEEQMGRRLLLLIAPMVVMFAVLPLGALILAYKVTPTRDSLFWILLIAGAGLILTFGSYLMSILFGWIWNVQRNGGR